MTAFLLIFVGCKENKKDENTDQAKVVENEIQHPGSAVVKVKTTGMNFILPESIPSGWTTFEYKNESPWSHFMLVDRMPVYEGKQLTFTDFTKEVPQVFYDAYDLIKAGEMEKGFEEFGNLPAWFSNIVFSGGVGLVSPGETARTTLYLEPGTYVVECYVKTDGVFHPMRAPLVVTDSGNMSEEPEADFTVSISKEKGIVIDGKPEAGQQRMAVFFEDQEAHEHLLGHDVHVVKLEHEGDAAAVNAWMNWIDINGLETPAPVTFIGGTQDMPEGSTAYVDLNLDPGMYALVSEVPDPLSKNMLKVFTIEINP